MARRGGLVVGALLSMAQASASDVTPAESARGLPGLIRVGIPTPASALIVIAGGSSYGWLDPAADLSSSGHRLGATLGAAITPWPELSLAVDARSYLDVFPHTESGSDTNLYGEPRLTARFSQIAIAGVYWGAEAELRLVGREAPSVYGPAASGSARGLLGVQLRESTWLGAQLGFHVDRSAKVLPDPARVSASDRRTLQSSSWNAVQWGVGVSHRWGALRTELIGELSGELLLGARAPGFFASPWQLGVGARQPLSEALALSVSAEVGLSTARRSATPDELRPIPPRLSAGINLEWRWGSFATAAPLSAGGPGEAPPQPAPPAASPPVVAVSTPVAGIVVDEGGRPLPDARVTLMRPGAQPAEEHSSESGSFSFAQVPPGPVELRVVAAGFDPASLAIAEGEPRTREIVLHASVPAGQVRGRVLDLSGTPLPAHLTISPGEHELEVNADGAFSLELAPGRYSVKIEHPGFQTQQRVIAIRERGVVILNVALSR